MACELAIIAGQAREEGCLLLWRRVPSTQMDFEVLVASAMGA